MQKRTSVVQPVESLDDRLAGMLRASARPVPPAREQRFSARLALQRAFVAAPTD